MNKLIVSIIAVAVIIGGGAFFGGMKYAESRNPTGQSRIDLSNLSPEERQQRMQEFAANAGGQFRVSGGPGGQRNGAGFVAGEILSKDDKSITIKLPDGGSKIIFFSETTEITKSVSGATGDLEVGKTITANGSANSDGSITAQSIQLRPQTQNQ